MSETSIPRHMQAISGTAVPSPVTIPPRLAADAEDIARPATSAAVAPDLRLTGVSVVIPAYNEELVIGSVIVKAKQYVDRIIVVDDGSQDRTAEVAKLAGADVIRLDRNTGKAYAILLGLRHARERGCIVAVVLEGNGEHDPREIPRIIGVCSERDCGSCHWIPLPQFFATTTSSSKILSNEITIGSNDN